MNLSKSQKGGFTLIELLIVIAIIGILSTVVMAALSNAKGKGNDSAVKSNLVNLRTQAELIYASDYNFNAVCGSGQDSTIANAIAEADTLNGDGTVTCGDPASGSARDWAVAADLPGGGAFCVDSSGVGRTKTSGGTDYTSATGGVSPALDDANDLDCN